MPVALALALVSLFFLLQVVPHSHGNGHDDLACRLCQVAHIGIVPAVAGALLSLTLLYLGEIQTLLCLHFAEAFFAHSPSRAPPAQLS
jgi:hypothetical protein